MGENKLKRAVKWDKRTTNGQKGAKRYAHVSVPLTPYRDPDTKIKSLRRAYAIRERDDGTGYIKTLPGKTYVRPEPKAPSKRDRRRARIKGFFQSL